MAFLSILLLPFLPLIWLINQNFNGGGANPILDAFYALIMGMS